MSAVTQSSSRPNSTPRQDAESRSPIAGPAGGDLLDRVVRDAAFLPAKLQWRVAGYLRAIGAFDQAARLLDAVERRGGETLQLLEERARLAFAAGRLDSARVLLEERARRAPSATARIALARCYLETGRLADARAISDELAHAQPDLATVAALAADVARAAGDLELARSYYLGVLDAKPDSANALLSLSRLALDEDNPESAAAFFRRAVAAASEEATAHQLTVAADLALALAQNDRAAELKERALHIDRSRTAALLADVEAALKEVEPADRTALSPSRPLSPPVRARGADGASGRLGSPEADEHPLGAAGATHTRDRRAAQTDSSAAEHEVPPAEALPAFATDVDDPAADLDPRVIEVLQRDFGHHALRLGQAAVIGKVMQSRDTLAIMPTGAGKSLTFQLPALLRDGTTLVISPLIALMKDQVESLPPAVRQRTALINSTLSPEEMRRSLDDLAGGKLKLVYAAPERLRHHAFLRALRAARTSLVVVDEAHCISMWGHDFRPDYLFIPKALPELGNPALLAITATATPAMVEQIGVALGRQLDQVRISLFRPNLFYDVHRLDNREQKVAKVVEICRQERGSGIVYVSSRKDAESIAGVLRDNRVAAIPYHAGLDPDVRAQNQDRFMRGQVRVVVATVAFGMGVDKADVRFIVHLGPPGSLEAYAQESGRAGRDGKPARCVLLIAPTDESRLARQARQDEVDLESLRRVYATVKRVASGEWAIVDPEALLPAPDDDQDEEIDPRVALGVLDQADLVRRHPDAPVAYSLRWLPPSAGAWQREDGEDGEVWSRVERWLGPESIARGAATVRTAEACAAIGVSPIELDRLFGERPDLVAREHPRAVCLQLLPVRGDAAATLTNLLERARADARRRIRQVMAYADARRCRHATLAAHLGEKLAPCATSCDVCTNTASPSVRANGAATQAEPVRKQTGAADAWAVLEAVRTLPFAMGKTGLTKLLLGSVESRVRPDRSPVFGALKGVMKSRVEALIDRLIDDGFLSRDLDHEFKIVTLSRRGVAATKGELSAYEPPARPTSSAPASGRTALTPPGDADSLSVEDQALLDRLYAWRRARASTEAVPPYVVAHNSMLRSLALARPASAAALAEIPGFGPARTEKYGGELLLLIAEPDEPGFIAHR